MSSFYKADGQIIVSQTNEINENSTDEQYPSAKATYDALLKQAISIEVEPVGEEPQAAAYTMSRSASGVTVTNYFVNSNFDSTDGWTTNSGQTLSASGNKASVTAPAKTTFRLAQSTNKDVVSQNVGDVWFIKFHIEPDVAEPIVDGQPVLKISTNAGGANVNIPPTPVFNARENDYYGLFTIPDGAVANSSFICYTTINYSSTDTLERTCYFSKAVLVNLTEAYGKGNEPDDADDFYALLSTLDDAWFENTITIDGSTGGDDTGGDTGDDNNGDGGNDNGGNGGNTDIVSGSGYKLIITTSEGVETLYLYQGQNGKDGKDGTNGKDGFSPTIEVEKIEGGNRLIITDKNGTQTVDVKGGAQLDNTTDTKVTLSVADNYTLKLTNIYNYDNYGGVTYVDWGDGAFTDTTKGTLSDIEHKYTKGGTYTVTLVGLTHLPALTFRAKPVVGVEIGSIVRYMGKMAFNECYDLTEARIYADVPPDLELLSSGIGAFDLTVEKIIVPVNSMYAYSKAVKWSKYASVITADEFIGNVFADKVVTVGDGGDFATINDALNYLSMFYPLYKAKGIKCEIQILDGTIINEQIWVERIDLSYISITTNNPDNTVQVDVTGWTGVTHDTRNNRPFFSGENGARLPAIKCLFSCIVPEGGWVTGISTEADNTAVGYFCNRGSTGVICGEAIYEGSIAVGIENVGFENFYDNIIANNNSEIVLREAIARNAGRYGVMARHISRVSARSANITNCGQIAKNGECAGAYADRSSMMDVRFADVSGSYNGLQCFNTSNMTAVETIAKNITNIVADSREGSVINCAEMTIDGVKDVFKVLNGGTIIATSTAPTNVSGTLNSKERNTVDINGIIYG